jgi:glycosyltransferase involved in cell wall biosynthesis
MDKDTLHILIIPSWYFPADTDEISGRMFHHLASGLRAEGIDARIFYPEYSKKGPLFNRIRHQIEAGVPTWRVYRWFPPKVNTFLYKRWIKKCVTDLRWYIKKEGRPDVIHAQSYQAASICAALHKKIQIPYIYTERLSAFLTRDIPKFHLAFFRDIYATASLITSVSPGLASIMSPHSRLPVRVIPNFFDEAIFFPDKKVKKYEAFTFVSIGEPAHTKGLDLLIPVFARLVSMHHEIPMQLILIDRIPEKEELIKLAAGAGVDKNIIWTGLITQNEIADILRQSHVLVSASRIETFGKAMIEALACGIPVVATRTDGATFILKDPALGELAEVNNPASLLKAMGKVFAAYPTYDPATIHHMTAHRFSKKEVIGQWISHYKNVMS